MENRKENGRMSVPQFGGWENQAPGADTGYTMVFTRARADKKDVKSNIRPASLGNEQEFIAPPRQHQHHHRRHYPRQHHDPRQHYPHNYDNHGHHGHQDDSVVRKKNILTYLNCCIKP